MSINWAASCCLRACLKGKDAMGGTESRNNPKNIQEPDKDARAEVSVPQLKRRCRTRMKDKVASRVGRRLKWKDVIIYGRCAYGSMDRSVELGG